MREIKLELELVLVCHLEPDMYNSFMTDLGNLAIDYTDYKAYLIS